MNAIFQQLAVLALPVLLAITVHEAAHGFMARQLGDDTAYRLGRVTFNPLKHIDLVGTLLVPITIFALSVALSGSSLLFGWAKPVPVNWHQLRHPRRDMAFVALAGPGANLLMAFLWGLVILIAIHILKFAPNSASAAVLISMAAAGVLINLVLLALNLFPLLPLDGGRVINALLPRPLSRVFSRLEPFGLIILLVLLFTGILEKVLQPSVALLLAMIPGNAIVRELFPF
ncbi:site-2 protease family protein [Thiospirillum jenense]|uniref:Site-2 protease family protein n=1 Tax=Thiospirillum jenense TaxID=1653858 RepID=A0A839HE63_9GAMM|nr:site-2 protease family protein [Thiospirillum jenense]MBB1125676.1 site-2 protease family protein [Thiospirillum jenense]